MQSKTEYPEKISNNFESCNEFYWPRIRQNGHHRAFQGPFYCPQAKIQSKNARIQGVRAQFWLFWAILGHFGHVQNFGLF